MKIETQIGKLNRFNIYYEIIRAKLFSDKRVHGVSPIKVEQVTFEEISVTANSDGMCQCAVRGTRGEKEKGALMEIT